ncbi:MAG: hypothetical protein ACYCZL_02235 [Polaromonas sp.]
MGVAPSWRQQTDAHCHSRALLVALFLQLVGSKLPALLSGLFFDPAAFLCHFFWPCGQLHPACFTDAQEKQGSSARQNGICNRELGAAPSRRTHEISSEKNQRTQDMTSPGKELARTSKLPMSTAFHAHYLLLYCVQLVSS